MNNKSPLILGLLALLVLVASNSLYVVKETERAVLLKFGAVVQPDVKPGLHIKIPFVNTVRKFDARLLTLDSPSARYLTLEKKAVIVDYFAKWRIADVEKFYTSTSGDEMNAQNILARRINDGLRAQFGRRSMHEVVSGQRDELMEELTTRLDKTMRAQLGIELVDIRVKQIDLPAEVSESVYARMNTERQREAREHRAQGRELAEGISAAAERQRTIIEANAFRDSQVLRGEGDAEAASIYANAYNQDPEFYAFVRSLEAYRNSFSNKSDIMVVDPSSDFFRYLGDSKGKK
ncbi:Modulator of FtsH protease HflC [Sinobacterium norvegicum]|uniref:Protein HflC n=1 Tax=Sinobacterium norvegicum TaxID=1641715 RepID=A0ABM9AFC5_9GAMM|nr:protease modulator HflC [Sinobacterium norvegicum]CAH0991658.1 Modulator of FtsH protease HflC [Sinobacterium norvegicum]